MTVRKIGIDLDNTIINYKNSFKIFCKRNKLNIKIFDKKNLKIYLDKNKNLPSWTEAQEEIYGNLIKFAKLFKHYKKFEKNLIKNNFKIFIISHKTKYSQFSKKYDLRLAANKWINQNLKIENYKVYFCRTIIDKIRIINDLKLDYYIDDLTKILNNKLLNKKTNKILFEDCDKRNWSKILKHIIKDGRI